MKKRVVWILIAVVGSLCGPGSTVAQLFQHYEVGTWGWSGDLKQPHPKRMTLTLGVSEDLTGWQPCVYYHSGLDTSEGKSRLRAVCRLWRNGQPIETRQISEQVQFWIDDTWWSGASTGCTCASQVFERLDKGDVLECEIRFRGFPPLDEPTGVGVSVSLAEDGDEWCGGF